MDAPEWVWDAETDLTLNERALYAALVRFRQRDGDGRAWPSRATLAASTGMSEATVKRSMPGLLATGLVSSEARVRPGMRRNDSTMYVVHAPKDRPASLRRALPEDEVTAGHHDPRSDQDVSDSDDRPRVNLSRPRVNLHATAGHHDQGTPPIEPLLGNPDHITADAAMPSEDRIRGLTDRQQSMIVDKVGEVADAVTANGYVIVADDLQEVATTVVVAAELAHLSGANMADRRARIAAWCGLAERAGSDAGLVHDDRLESLLRDLGYDVSDTAATDDLTASDLDMAGSQTADDGEQLHANVPEAGARTGVAEAPERPVDTRHPVSSRDASPADGDDVPRATPEQLAEFARRYIAAGNPKVWPHIRRHWESLTEAEADAEIAELAAKVDAYAAHAGAR